MGGLVVEGQRLCSQGAFVAGALVGISEGLCRTALGSWRRQPGGAVAPLGTPATTTPPPLVRSALLLNLVIVGDAGAGKSSLAYMFAGGRDGRLEATRNADLLVHQLSVAGRRLTLSLWLLAGREVMEDMDRTFFALASGVILVYNPVEREGALQSLDYWSQTVLPGQRWTQHPPRPLMVVASCRHGLGREEHVQQAATVEAAKQWCAAHSLPHIAVHGLQDTAAVRQAFLRVVEAVVRQQEGSMGSSAAVYQSNPLFDREGTRSSQLEDLELPILMQSELGPLLQRLTPAKPGLLATSRTSTGSDECGAAVWAV